MRATKREQRAMDSKAAMNNIELVALYYRTESGLIRDSGWLPNYYKLLNHYPGASVAVNQGVARNTIKLETGRTVESTILIVIDGDKND